MRSISRVLCAGASLATILTAAPALAAGLNEPATFEIPAGSLDEALIAYSRQASVQVVSASTDLAGKRTRGVAGTHDPREALAVLLRDSGLSFAATSDRTVTVMGEQGAGGGSAETSAVDALIVTAQKREENIQDVPIAISAFSQEALEAQKIEGGFDLLKAIPNVTFSKNNFSSYNFSIRGIGTKAVSITTDPGVAVAFNSSPILRNRLFEQEYLDMERVEVLRGPQGTLYGRNATAGVINAISAKPQLGEFEGWLKAEVGNYDTRRMSAMVNAPLGDMFALRLAGAATKRDGFDYNTVTDHPVNGRDLWTIRATLGFEPNERIRADLIWERFEEDDDRSRTGKQLCHRDPGPAVVGSTPVFNATRGLFSQGCKAGSLYDPMAFAAPNGFSIPFIAVATDTILGYTRPADGSLPSFPYISLIPEGVDPYAGMMQSPDLRKISSIVDPVYRAETDVFELNVDFELTPELTITSQTAYAEDQYYSRQDYNRFNSVPIFNDSSTLVDIDYTDFTNPLIVPAFRKDLLPGGYFNDPQVGRSQTIAGMDLSKSKSSQFSQEIRLTSNYDGPLNFSAGANYLRYRTVEDYMVFFNLVTLFATSFMNQSADIYTCGLNLGITERVPFDDPDAAGCVYIDPNPIDSINGEGHNYYRNSNPYKLESTSAFGELYWEATPDVKVTAGLRYTNDQKTFTPIPTQMLLASYPLWGGTVDRGYPRDPDIKQEWGEVTGRFGVDWSPDLGFTDESMIYAFYSRGYKGGGSNPAGIGYSKEIDPFTGRPLFYTSPFPKTFEPEFVDAFELGAKNTLLQGALLFNVGGFFYDYKDYQVSKIVDRTAVNENYDAKVWGLEFETVWSPAQNIRIIANLGYQDSEIADGEESIDLMDRLQGQEGYVLVKPWIQLTSNCVAPVERAEANASGYLPVFLCPGSPFGVPPEEAALWPNGGQGFMVDIGGKELPNTPHWTTNIAGQWGFEFGQDWRAIVRGDAYWQSQSWARVYNAINDKLHGWYNVNLSLLLEREDGLAIEVYAKNLLDKTPITDAFLNSDDTALTTNVFVLDPRLIGLSIRKAF